MGRLIYSAICSLDGYVADAHGNFDWSMPDEHVHRAVNDLLRPVGTHLYGRRMYEVLSVWESPSFVQGQPDYIADFAGMWRSAEKIVYSTTLDEVSSERTRIERAFDPVALRGMKADAAQDLSIGGPEIAAAAMREGLVDDIHLFFSPVIVGGGTPALPEGLRLPLELVDEGRFGNGVVRVHYRTQPER